MTVGERIKQRRKELGLTQDELAKRMGYNGRSGVCAAETKEDNITTTKVAKFAKALGVSQLYLMGYEDANGNPIDDGEHYSFPFDPNAYRTDFLEKAVEYYQKIQKLSSEHQAELESYLEYLQTREGSRPKDK